MLSPAYHYIICGAGCAGMSLLMRMMRDPFFSNKKILVIDASQKNTNDRTWCFWEKEAGIFEPIVHHRWQALDFYSDDFSATLSIDPYQYKMIRGIDLYDHVKAEASHHPNIEWLHEKVIRINSDPRKATVTLAHREVEAEMILNSIVFEKPAHEKKGIHLLQHFKGWFITTPIPVFNPHRATFMDFRVSQEEGTTFAYVLPTSTNTALVEYTLFSKELLREEAYNDGLRNYIKNHLQLDQYEIAHEEFGVIPMSTQQFPLQEKRIVHIGIAGGQVKASSGYAFRFIQQRAAHVADGLKNGKTSFDQVCFTDRKFRFYDKVLLTVLNEKKMRGADIFARIFERNSPERVLQFLDNQSGFINDLQIMRSVPASVFLPAAIASIG